MIDFLQREFGDSPFFGLRGDPEDSHFRLLQAYDDGRLDDKLWNFGEGTRWARMDPPLSSSELLDETLCGLQIPTGLRTIDVDWAVFDRALSTRDLDRSLPEMHEVTCMICRRKLAYGMFQIVRRLTELLDAVGSDYVRKAPLVHGKIVLESKQEGGIYSEISQSLCAAARGEVSPHYVDFEKETQRITCPHCLEQLAG